MKTKYKIIVACVCFALCVALFITIVATKSEPVVQNAEDAISIAMPAFVERFGDDDGDTLWKAEYDQLAGTWHVYGILLPMNNELILGGTPEAIISAKDGQIIRIWHSK